LNAASIRRHLPALGLLLILTLATRLAWLGFVHPNPNDGRFDDTAWYYNSAALMAHGRGYISPYAGTPTAAWPPGYPAFLAAVFKAFGVGLTQAYVANVVLAVLTVGAVYCIGLLLFERRTALIGAAAMALWPGQVVFVSLALSEILFSLLLVVAILLVLLLPRAGTSRGPLAIAFGIATAAAALTRGQALMLLPLAPVIWALSGLRWRRAIGWGILAASVTAVLLVPWVARNQRQLDSPVLIATNLGGNLWLGNHAGSQGRMQTAQPIPLVSRVGITEPQYEVKNNSILLHKALAYMSTHPVNEVRLAALKLRALYESDATGLDWNTAYDVHGNLGAADGWLRGLANGFWFAAIGLAGVGLIADRARLRGALAALPLTLLLWTGVHLIFFGDSRFHFPVTFIIALLAARGVVAVYAMIPRRLPSFGRRYATV
jgi:hypothetical protein